MRSAQIRLHEVFSMFRRRWKLVVIPTIIVCAACIIAAFQLPRKYEATTTMLTRPDETLNVVRGFDASAYDDQLRSYGEIIYSNAFIQNLIDSLGIGRHVETEFERQGLITDVKRLISTDRRADAFTITFANSNPDLAKRGAEVIATMFIQTQVRMDNRENLLTIEFLEKKVDELRIQFEASTRVLVSSMEQNNEALPTETKSLYAQISDAEGKINAITERMKSYGDDLSTIQLVLGLFRTNPEAMRTETGKEPLLGLEREDLPYASDLRALITKYDDLTQRYTGRWPEIEKQETQLALLLDRIRVAVGNSVEELKTQRADLERSRAGFIEEARKSSLLSRLNQDRQSSYEISQKLYNDMKGKLEQARLKAEVESKGASQYLILDPPVYPVKPTKPNRRLLALAGLGLGFALGIVSVIVAELFDTTIRTPKDMEVYEKPIIALLPEGTGRYR